MEIKWKDKISKKDILRAEEVLNLINAKERYLIVPDKKGLKSKLKIKDASDL